MVFHFDADPDPDPSFQMKAQNLKKVYSNLLIFHTFWLVICKLMRFRIRIQLKTLMRIRIQILPFFLKRIHANPDPNPQHGFQQATHVIGVSDDLACL
jgi:hypothetical protein